MKNTLKNAIDYKGFSLSHVTLKGGSKIWNAYKSCGGGLWRIVGSDFNLDALKAKLDNLK